jgi:hypothetical protein
LFAADEYHLESLNFYQQEGLNTYVCTWWPC